MAQNQDNATQHDAHAVSDAEPWISGSGVSQLVSIIIPTCNRSTLLQETLQSIVSQDYRPLQIIIVDDASTDDTSTVVEEWIARHPDVDLQYERQEKAGGPAARNRGARRATGEFIIFMDDDDVYADGFLSAHVQTLRDNPDATMSYCRWQRFKVEGSQYGMFDQRGEIPQHANSPWEAFLRQWNLLLQGCMLRRSAVELTGPWRLDLLKSQDLDYKARLLAIQPKAVEAKGALAFYRLHKASVSGKFDDKKVRSYLSVLETIETIGQGRDDYANLRPILADYFWSHGYWLYTQGYESAAWQTMQLAMKHDKQVMRRNGPTLARLLAKFGLQRVAMSLLVRLYHLKVAFVGAQKLESRDLRDHLPLVIHRSG